jgi:hypothetical protein
MSNRINTEANTVERNAELQDMCFSDFFKDINGFRPRGSTWDYYLGLSPEALEKALDRMDAEMEEQLQESRRQEKEDVAAMKAEIQNAIDLGAKTETDALRWITQNEDFYSGQCVESFVWRRGILFTPYGKELVEKILDVAKFKEFA